MIRYSKIENKDRMRENVRNRAQVCPSSLWCTDRENFGNREGGSFVHVKDGPETQE